MSPLPTTKTNKEKSYIGVKTKSICVINTTMDSFYPKFGEVELVLVDDDNDFYDPLETNFECEEEDTKLQLNDTVYEESQFLWNTEETSNRSSVDEDDIDGEAERTIKREISYENCDYNDEDASNHVENFDEPHENSNDSYDTGQECFQNNDSNHSSDIELKPKPCEILEAANKQEAKEIVSEKDQKIEPTNDIVKIEKDQKKMEKVLKKKRKKDNASAESSSECSVKKEPKTRKKYPKEENTV